MFALLVLGSIYFLYGGAKSELAPQEDQGVVISSATPAPNATLDQKLLYSRQIYDIMAKFPETAHVFQIDAPGVSIAGHGIQAVGRALADRQPTATLASAAAQCGRRRARRGIPAAASARQPRIAGAIRDHHHRLFRPAQYGRPAVPAGRGQKRDVHLSRHGPQDRQSGIGGRDRSQQDGTAWAEDERRWQRHGLDAGRRLRQLFQPGPALLQGNPPGAAKCTA